VAGRRLLGKDEAGKAGAGKVPDKASEILTAATLRVDHMLDVLIEIADGHCLVLMLFPPFREKLGNYLAAAIALLGLAYAQDGVLAAEREQRIAYPSAPSFEAAERTARLDAGCMPSPPPYCKKSSEQFRPPLYHLVTNIGRNGRSSGSSMPASKTTSIKRRARSSETVRALPVRITKDEAFSGTI
jgi:hypothetical protein